MSKINIRISIVVNAKIYSEEINISLSFFEFKRGIEKKLNQSLRDHTFYFNNIKIPELFTGTMKDIIKFEENPLFIIKKNADPSILLNTADNSNKFVSKVSITSFPSRTEVFMIVDNFLDKNSLHKQYFSENKENEILITFKNPEVAFEFIKHVNALKLQSNLYSKMKTSMYLGIKQYSDSHSYTKLSNNSLNKNKKSYFSNFKSSNDKSSLDINHNNSRNNNDNELYQNNSNSKILYGNSNDNYFDNLSKNLRSNKQIIDSSFTNNEKGSSRNQNKSHVIGGVRHPIRQPHLNQLPTFVRLASPYKSDEDKEHEEYKINKDKWLVKKGFLTHIKPEENYIKNFVNVTQFKVSPKNYKFRKIDKKKWITNKGFDSINNS